ncbi:hypothetical protein FB451DRAFT_152836 [Mycena latifolia]|nr:hypothetical protein FB451DRAFT_152836 [Mycena latifolia]
MKGMLILAGLFSASLTAFRVTKLLYLTLGTQQYSSWPRFHSSGQLQMGVHLFCIKSLHSTGSIFRLQHVLGYQSRSQSYLCSDCDSPGAMGA